MNKVSQHVAPGLRGGWVVRKSGALRASRVFKTRSDAVTYARRLAQRERVALYVHGRDGTVSERNSYGSESVAPGQ